MILKIWLYKAENVWNLNSIWKCRQFTKVTYFTASEQRARSCDLHFFFCLFEFDFSCSSCCAEQSSWCFLWLPSSRQSFIISTGSALFFLSVKTDVFISTDLSFWTVTVVGLYYIVLMYFPLPDNSVTMLDLSLNKFEFPALNPWPCVNKCEIFPIIFNSSLCVFFLSIWDRRHHCHKCVLVAISSEMGDKGNYEITLTVRSCISYSWVGVLSARWFWHCRITKVGSWSFGNFFHTICLQLITFQAVRIWR